jgi:repressor LexA
MAAELKRSRSRPDWQRLPVVCARCGRAEVCEHRTHDRLLVRCLYCETWIVRYYNSPGGGSEPAEESISTRLVERELMREVKNSPAALYIFIRRYIKAHGYAPTLREMSDEFAWRSTSSASHYLKQLEEVGLIERDYSVPRGIRMPLVD